MQFVPLEAFKVQDYRQYISPIADIYFKHDKRCSYYFSFIQKFFILFICIVINFVLRFLEKFLFKISSVFNYSLFKKGIHPAAARHTHTHNNYVGANEESPGRNIYYEMSGIKYYVGKIINIILLAVQLLTRIRNGD